jgi:TolB-like protein/DNA-binding winged helix-turn-helix (wHTH) protein
VFGFYMNDDNDIIQFADVRLDRRRAVLERNGAIVQVRPRTFALLSYLAENPDRVISKDEILAAVWRRVAVSDDALTQTIKDVRRVIDDRDATILRTIPKRGFLFTDDGAKRPIRADALEVGESAQLKPAPETQPPKPMMRFPLAPMIVGIMALAAIAIGAWRFLDANSKTTSEAAHLSIVVLPFKNLSGDPGQDYFADGVTDNLTTDLSRIRDSFVIAASTAFTYKGRPVDAKEIGKQLSVRYVLEGSVQRDQDRVRVNAQLVDAQSGAHLWADRFEEDVADLFKLQDQVVARLANTLGIELVRAEAEKATRAKSPDAVDLDMRGWALVRRAQFTKETNQAARALFEQSLKIDPGNADALAGGAYTYSVEYIIWRTPDTDYDTKIFGLTDQAIAIAPDALWAYVVKGVYLQYSRRADKAIDAANAGLAINSNFVYLWSMRGAANVFAGHFEQAKSDILRALRLSPRDPRSGTWTKYLGDAEFGLGHFDAAIDNYHRAVNLGGAVAVYPSLAAASALAGKMDEAKTALAEARRLEPKFTVKWMTPQPWVPPIPSLFDGLRKAGLSEE